MREASHRGKCPKCGKEASMGLVRINDIHYLRWLHYVSYNRMKHQPRTTSHYQRATPQEIRTIKLRPKTRGRGLTLTKGEDGFEELTE